RGGDRGGELRATWSAQFPLSRLRVSAGGLHSHGFNRWFFQGMFSAHQRTIAAERFELAADSARHLRATARAAVRVFGFDLAGGFTEGRRMSVGGARVRPESKPRGWIAMRWRP